MRVLLIAILAAVPALPFAAQAVTIFCPAGVQGDCLGTDCAEDVPLDAARSECNPDHCDGVGRWGAGIGFLKGSGGVKIQAKCGDSVVAECEANDANGRACDTGLVGAGSGSHSCPYLITSGSPRELYGGCYDPWTHESLVETMRQKEAERSPWLHWLP